MKTIEEIQEEYKHNLCFPKQKPAVQCLVCPVGLIGSGKTTDIKPIAKEINLVRVSTDEYRILLKENGQGYETVKLFIRSTCKQLLEEGYSIALDANCGGQTAYTFIKKAESELDIRVFWLSIYTPETYAVEGLRKRQSPMIANNEDWVKNRANQKDRMQALNYEFDFFYEFDISQVDLNEQISSCVEKLKAEIY